LNPSSISAPFGTTPAPTFLSTWPPMVTLLMMIDASGRVEPSAIVDWTSGPRVACPLASSWSATLRVTDTLVQPVSTSMMTGNVPSDTAACT
jgi:hypothetical protein